MDLFDEEHSEDNILVFVLFHLIELIEDVFIVFLFLGNLSGTSVFRLLSCLFSCFNFFGFFLDILDALQSVEIFSIELIKLTFNPLDGPFNLRDDDEFKSIDSSVSDLDDSVNSNVLCLVRGNLDQKPKIFSETLLHLHDGLTTTSESDNAVLISLVETLNNEGWLFNTCNVFFTD